MCWITGRPFYQLKKVSGSFAGRKGLKDQGFERLAVQSHIFIRFQGFKCIPGLFSRAVFPILCLFEAQLAVAYVQFFFFKQSGSHVPVHLFNVPVSLSKVEH